MRKLLISASLLFLSLPAAAEATDLVRVDREGYKLEYSITPQADGSQLISGREVATNEPFTLRIAGQNVSGDVGGQQVSFRVARKVAAAMTTTDGN